MADWISKMAEEGRRRVGEQQEEAEVVSQIKADSRSLMEELEARVQRDMDQVNRELYNSAKVFEVRRDFDLFGEGKTNDFVAMTADYPAATLYVLLNPSHRILTRKLVTKKDSDSNYEEKTLPVIGVRLDSRGNVAFVNPRFEHVNGGLSLDKVARLIVEPVVSAHTGIDTSEDMGHLGKALPVSRSQAANTKPKALIFSFVVDSRIARILERDYEELQGLDPDKSTKAVLVLSGGIIEGLLFDALVANGNLTFDVACNEPLKNMIHPAMKEKIIKQDKLTDVLRSYRNLIHPAREVRDSVSFTKSDAKLAIHAVDIIMGEVREWHSSRVPASAKADGGKASPE